MPSRFLISLQPRAEIVDRAWRDSGPAVNAAFLHAVEKVDASTSAALHDERVPMKPFAITPIIRSGTGSKAEWHIEIGLLDDTLDPVVSRAVEGALDGIFIGDDWFGVVGAQVHRADFGELIEAAPHGASWSIELVTPTSFRLKAGGTERVAAFPSPELVFPQLARRFEHFAGPDLLPDGLIERTVGRIEVSGFDLRTRPHLVKAVSKPGRATRRVRQVGAVGWLDYRLKAAGESPAADRQALGGLLAFAQAAGLGDRTTRGMGYVRHRQPGGADQ